MDCFLRGVTPGILVGLALLHPGGPVRAADFFLTLGGGYDPTGNQLPLERNVQRFQQVLAELRPDAPLHDVYFADGDDQARDLQYLDNRLAAELLSVESGDGGRQ